MFYFVQIQLVAVLREVKYLRLRSVETVPDSAAKVFEKNEVLRDFRINLDMIVQWYSYLCNRVTEIEAELIRDELAAFDEHTKQAENSLSWEKDGENCTPSD